MVKLLFGREGMTVFEKKTKKVGIKAENKVHKILPYIS